MLERGIQTVDDFRSCFEQRRRFGLIDFANIAAQMFDQFPKFFSNIGGMRPRIF